MRCEESWIPRSIYTRELPPLFPYVNIGKARPSESAGIRRNFLKPSSLSGGVLRHPLRGNQDSAAEKRLPQFACSRPASALRGSVFCGAVASFAVGHFLVASGHVGKFQQGRRVQISEHIEAFLERRKGAMTLHVPVQEAAQLEDDVVAQFGKLLGLGKGTTRETPVDAALPGGWREIGDGERSSSESEDDNSDELSVDKKDDRRRRRRRRAVKARLEKRQGAARRMVQGSHLDEALRSRGNSTNAGNDRSAPLSEASQLLLSKESVNGGGGSRVFGTGRRSGGRGGGGGGSGVGRGLFGYEQGNVKRQDGDGEMGRAAGSTGADDDAATGAGDNAAERAEEFEGFDGGGRAVRVAVTWGDSGSGRERRGGAEQQKATGKQRFKDDAKTGVVSATKTNERKRETSAAAEGEVRARRGAKAKRGRGGGQSAGAAEGEARCRR
ncbi:MAG: hypothetical protein BJ554DRAFT_228 [Olpidium bornovanus]|uniref:Uncharacterized protein n=1 Tax=Olpidium bornovanus TaxID=278681 RepID=A0A8H7ZTK6_9FUNG|nr:MAG: hypothetical protein BJ554DRAFT_228 [Olpidium bornovanus]